MRTKKVRLISAAMAGGLVLTGVTAAAIANTSNAPTRLTLAADKTSSAVNLGNCPTLAEGDHGGCVNQLQTELNADDGANLPVTGTFGPATKAAVIIFQQEHHIVPAEGIVGPQTKAALDNPGSSSAAPPPGQLNPGQRITSGTQIASPDGRFVLQMQSDGNLVIRAPGNIPLGDTHTAGHDGTIAVMQADGNFVLRAPGNIPVWSSGTDGHPGTVLQVQDDGGVVLYAPGHQVLRVIFPAVRDPQNNGPTPTVPSAMAPAPSAPAPSAFDPPGGCTVGDASKGIVSRHLYKEYHREICEAAINAGIDPILLAITIQHEGSGRMKYLSSSAGKDAEFFQWTYDPGNSVGIGQMQVPVAAGLLNKYAGSPGIDYYTNNESEIAYILTHDTRQAIQLAAYYLRDLRDTYGFDDRQAYVAYAFEMPARYDDLVGNNFQGPQAVGRWNSWNNLFAEISTHSGYDLTQTPNELRFGLDDPSLPSLF